LAVKYPNLGETVVLLNLPHVFLLLLIILFVLLSMLFLIVILTTARRIERFDEYTAEIRKKWGDDVI
jgi:hypothetical protein